MLTAYTGPGGDVVIPDGVTSIGREAFYYCTSLTSVTIPEGVTTIERGAFEECAGLTSISVADNNQHYLSQDGVLFDKDKTMLVSYPAGKEGAYTIPDGVTTIGDGAFHSCTSLTGITIPASVNTIKSFAFCDCIGLTDIAIPSSVTTIGEYAFSLCAGLTHVTIPNSVIIIEPKAFYCCAGLTDIAVAENNPAYTSLDGCLLNKDLTTLIQYPSAKMGVYHIPDSVTTIEDSAFYGSAGLTSVTIPDSVTAIGSTMFSFCRNLTDIAVAEGNPVYASLDGVLFSKDMTTLIQCPAKKEGVYHIPDSVTVIGALAFSDCSDLTDVTIPEGVTTIWVSAFYRCKKLTGVTIPASVTKIWQAAFASCTDLTDIAVAEGNPAYVSLDGVLFSKDMTTLIQYPAGKAGAYTIPVKVTHIESSAFNGCKNLINVVIPDSVTQIEIQAFVNCTGLVNATILNSEVSIGVDAFQNCENLTVYGQAGSEVEGYCIQNDIPFVVGFPSGTAQTGSLKSDNGESVAWAITEEGEITIDVAAADLAPEEKVLVGCYDQNGQFTGVKWLDAQSATAQLDPSTPNVKLFWLGAAQNPLAPSVTVWKK